MLTAEIATKIYIIVVIIIERTSALGITFFADFVSSDNFIIASNPINAKKIKAAAVEIPENPFGISSKLTEPIFGIPINIMKSRPKVSTEVQNILSQELFSMP